MPKNLTKAQARQVQEIIDRARRNDGIPRTAQQSIPFQRMFPDGICRVSDKYYTKTIQYQDINYQLAQQEDKTAIFEEWCSFLNFFDSSIHFELSFMNMATDAEVFEKNIRIPYRNDNFNNVRSEYSQMLKMQLAQGNIPTFSMMTVRTTQHCLRRPFTAGKVQTVLSHRLKPDPKQKQPIQVWILTFWQRYSVIRKWQRC